MARLVFHLQLDRVISGLSATIGSGIINTIQLGPLCAPNQWKFIYRINNFYEFTYVPWVDGGIGYGLIPSGYDFLSTRFEGCYMAVYTDFSFNASSKCGAHIHIGDNSQKDKWNRFVVDNSLSGILFKPNSYTEEKIWIYNNLMYEKEFQDLRVNIQTWGIISQNECISLLMYKDKLRNEWKIASFGKNKPLNNLLIP